MLWRASGRDNIFFSKIAISHISTTNVRLHSRSAVSTGPSLINMKIYLTAIEFVSHTSSAGLDRNVNDGGACQRPLVESAR